MKPNKNSTYVKRTYRITPEQDQKVKKKGKAGESEYIRSLIDKD